MIGKERIHGMDALRGIAMWMGVVLHSVMSYQVDPRGGWPSDSYSSIGMDYIYSYLHAFRMPIFFLVAGFFANFLIKKIGWSDFAYHRVKRILIPFILSVLVIVPVSGFVFAYYRVSQMNLSGNLFPVAIRESFSWTGLYHIWFLYYLLILYGLSFIFSRMLSKSNFKVVKITEGKFLLTTIFLFMIQFIFYDGKVEAWTGIIPKIGQIFYYGYFFLMGYFIYNNVDFLFQNKNLRFFYILIGILIIPFNFYAQEALPYWVYAFSLSIQTNILILGNIAFFMIVFRESSRWVRYFSDASYWFYLIHLPIVVAIQLYLMNFNINIWFKWLIVIISTTAISIISYEFLVRYTKVGELLNGKKTRKKKNTEYVNQ